MCGRFTLTVQPEKLLEIYPVVELPEEWEPSYNIAPSQPVAVIANRDPDRVQLFRWGLVPFWARDEKVGYKMINARADSLAEKPAFRRPLEKRRCLVLADGFYEWKTLKPKKKIPYHIVTGEPFAFAGLWEFWRNPETENEVRSCTIVTTDANAKLRELHERMPVILPREHWDQWLDPKEGRADVLLPLLKPYPGEKMSYREVSTLVNNPDNDGPECLEPPSEPALF